MLTRGIREFVSRDWQAARENKDLYWGGRIARLGPAEAFRIGDDLRRQMLVQNPDWPDSAAREDDLRAHARLSELFRRAGPTRRR